jgi:uncharacterized repeat protein (TIGR03803 family)
MHPRVRASILLTAAFSVAITLSTGAAASTERILHSFTGNPDGYDPSGGSLTFDKAGNIYCATYNGGTGTGTFCSLGCGTIFKLTRTNSGWTESVIYNFAGGTADGSQPNGDLVIDSSGNLYGTTYFGGAYTYGTVFELTPTGSGWSKKILHSFASGSDGVWPTAGMVIDGKGNLYGVAAYGGGGTVDGGIAFELSPSAHGFVYTILHVFGNGADGANPYSRLTMGSSGHLFGTTGYGGPAHDYCGSEACGTAFELTRGPGNVWTESVIYNFGNSITDASQPYAPLVLDSLGNLYGTSLEGGSCISNCGTVFEISPASGGTWTEQVLFSFLSSATGTEPRSGLVMDSDGSLYGTTVFGGGGGTCKADNENLYCGLVFEFTLEGGIWTESVLHEFGYKRQDGTEPYGAVIRGASGNLYGTTSASGGGTTGGGVVYEVIP